jgi:hypothetical protein
MKRRARMGAPTSAATSLKLRPARRLPTAECGRLARPPAPGSPSTASAALDQRSFAEDFGSATFGRNQTPGAPPPASE